jgi:long-chain acyl-CoA synthetase
VSTPHTIRDLIDARAEQVPDDVYLIAPEPGRRLSYGQLRDDCATFGRYLMKLGLQKGCKVSFMLGNGYQTPRIFLGAMYSGFVITPLNLMAQPAHLEYVLAHSDTEVVFFEEAQREGLEAASRSVDRDLVMIPIDKNAESIVPASEDLSDSRLPDVDEEDDALLLYTSGTTGQPKGVILSHKNVVAGGRFTTLAHELTAADRALCSLPLYHINGEIVTVVAPLVSGGSVVMPRGFSRSRFWKLISEHGCTWFSVVPTILSYLLSDTEWEPGELQLDQLRFGRSASSALPPSLHRDFEERFGVSIIETMGLTETAAPVFSNPLQQHKRKYGSPGQAVGNQAKIVDPSGAELPRGESGEIMIRGDNVMKGYYKAPELTSEAIEPDGWLHTGDLGYMDADGFVFVTGRTKELIIKGGENIAPKEIDEVLYAHPAVQDCAAVGIPDEYYGEDILCGVVLKPGVTATEEELIRHCREQLGYFKTPRRIRFMDELPKGPSGKIQRLKLRDIVGSE